MNLLTVLLLTAIALTANLQAADTDKEPTAHKTEKSDAELPVKTVTVAEFEKLRASKTNVVLDVRTPKEFKAGSIPNAVNIDVNAPDFEEKVKALDTNKVYLVHCAYGGRGANAVKKLGQLNFDRVYNLEGGIKAWEKAGNKPQR